MRVMITTVTGKNQITLPAKLARQLDIKPGTRLQWEVGEDGVLLLRPLPGRAEMARKIAGMGRSWLKRGKSAVQELIDERASD